MASALGAPSGSGEKVHKLTKTGSAALAEFQRYAQDNVKNLKLNQERYYAEQRRRRTPVTAAEDVMESGRPSPVPSATSAGPSGIPKVPKKTGRHSSIAGVTSGLFNSIKRVLTGTPASAPYAGPLAGRRPSASSMRSDGSTESDALALRNDRSTSSKSVQREGSDATTRDRALSDPGEFPSSMQSVPHPFANRGPKPADRTESPEEPEGRKRGKRIITAPAPNSFSVPPEVAKFADVVSPPDVKKASLFRAKPETAKTDSIQPGSRVGSRKHLTTEAKTEPPMAARDSSDTNDDASVVVRSDSESETDGSGADGSVRDYTDAPTSPMDRNHYAAPPHRITRREPRTQLSTVKEHTSDSEEVSPVKAKRPHDTSRSRNREESKNQARGQDQSQRISEIAYSSAGDEDSHKLSTRDSRHPEPLRHVSSIKQLTPPDSDPRGRARTAEGRSIRQIEAEALDPASLLPPQKKLYDLVEHQAQEIHTLEHQLEELNAAFEAKLATVDNVVQGVRHSFNGWKDEISTWWADFEEDAARRRDEDVTQHEIRLRTAILRKADKKSDEIRSKLNTLSAKMRDLESDSLRELGARIGSSLLAYAWNGVLVIVGGLVVLFGPVIGLVVAWMRKFGEISQGPGQPKGSANPKQTSAGPANDGATDHREHRMLPARDPGFQDDGPLGASRPKPARSPSSVAFAGGRQRSWSDSLQAPSPSHAPGYVLTMDDSRQLNSRDSSPLVGSSSRDDEERKPRRLRNGRGVL